MSLLRTIRGLPPAKALYSALSPTPARGIFAPWEVVASDHQKFALSPCATLIVTWPLVAVSYMHAPGFGPSLRVAGVTRMPATSAAVITSQGLPEALLPLSLVGAAAEAALIVVPVCDGTALCEQAPRAHSATSEYGISRTIAFSERILFYRIDNAWEKCSHTGVAAAQFAR